MSDPTNIVSKKRLLNELKSSQSSPLPSFLLSLGPISDSQISQWEAVMVGTKSSAYECLLLFFFSPLEPKWEGWETDK